VPSSLPPSSHGRKSQPKIQGGHGLLGIAIVFSRKYRFNLAAISWAARLGWSLGLASTKKPSGGQDVNGLIKVGAVEKDERSIQERRGSEAQRANFKKKQIQVAIFSCHFFLRRFMRNLSVGCLNFSSFFKTERG
jgi:hypothetical protein